MAPAHVTALCWARIGYHRATYTHPKESEGAGAKNSARGGRARRARPSGQAGGRALPRPASRRFRHQPLDPFAKCGTMLLIAGRWNHMMGWVGDRGAGYVHPVDDNRDIQPAVTCAPNREVGV